MVMDVVPRGLDRGQLNLAVTIFFQVVLPITHRGHRTSFVFCDPSFWRRLITEARRPCDQGRDMAYLVPPPAPFWRGPITARETRGGGASTLPSSTPAKAVSSPAVSGV